VRLGEVAAHGQPESVQAALGTHRFEFADQGAADTTPARGGGDVHPRDLACSRSDESNASAADRLRAVSNDEQEPGVIPEVVARVALHLLLHLRRGGRPIPVPPDDFREEGFQDPSTFRRARVFERDRARFVHHNS
jgi:hypothetical protein